MSKDKTNQNGITLIALIITIIVMLILVGVTVNVALNGSLFTKAQEAADQTKIEIAKEMLKEHVPIDKIIKFTGLTNEEIEKDFVKNEPTLGDSLQNDGNDKDVDKKSAQDKDDFVYPFGGWSNEENYKR